MATPAPLTRCRHLEARPSEPAALVRRIADGDSWALSELFDRYVDMLRALAERILGNPFDADEALQDTFLQVWSSARDYNPARASVTTWLALITRSRCLDRLRRRRFVERVHEEFAQGVPTAAAADEGYARVLTRARSSRIARAMSRLPRPQLQVLEHCYFRGLSQNETAAALDIPLGTVKTRAVLALKRLRTELAGEIDQLL